MTYTRLRVMAIGCTLALMIISPSVFFFKQCVFAMGFGHYIMAMIYSKAQFRELGGSARGVVSLVLFVLAGIVFFLHQSLFPLILYFGIHHIMNEVFIFSDMKDERLQRLCVTRVCLQVFVYLALLRKSLVFVSIPDTWIVFGLAASFAAFVLALRQARPAMEGNVYWDILCFEILGVIVVAATIGLKPQLLHVVMYHFSFWLLYPAMKLAKRGLGDLSRYAVLTLLITGVFVILSPLAILPIHLGKAVYFKTFQFFSYFHISSTFALSAANPRWLVRLVREWR